MKELEELNEMIANVGDIASKQGLNDSLLANNHYLMMIITEIAEAVQADRNGKTANMKAFKASYKEDDANFIFPDDLGKHRTSYMYAYEKYIEGSVEGELADIVIRIMSFLSMSNQKFTQIEDLDEIREIKSKEYFEENTFTEAAIDLTYAISKHYDGQYNNWSIADDLSYCVAFVLKWAKHLKFDLMNHIKLKIKYNSMREYKHGKKY